MGEVTPACFEVTTLFTIAASFNTCLSMTALLVLFQRGLTDNFLLTLVTPVNWYDLATVACMFKVVVLSLEKDITFHTVGLAFMFFYHVQL